LDCFVQTNIQETRALHNLISNTEIDFHIQRALRGEFDRVRGWAIIIIIIIIIVVVVIVVVVVVVKWERSLSDPTR
jgi:t-SNARE complex subunit (syntaxin)